LFPRVVAALLAIGCSQKGAGTLVLTTGGESDTFSRSPVPVLLAVEAVSADGGVRSLARVTLPADTVELGDVPETTVASVRVSGFDAAGQMRIWGQSLPFRFGDLAGQTLPLFVQRTGEFARLANGFAEVPVGPTVGLLLSRYVVVQLSSSMGLYDLVTYQAVQPVASFPRPLGARVSLVTVGQVALWVDDQGAVAVDLATGQAASPVAPSGGNFGEVAGGATVVGTDGASYVVGATRAEATSRVLRVDSSGGLSFLSLMAPRAGAGAVWVDGRGLVVVGGSASAPAVEVLGTALSFGPWATAGAAVVALDSHQVLAIGQGEVLLRGFDLSCTLSCTPTFLPTVLTGALTQPTAVTLSDGSILVAGDDATGGTQAVRLVGGEVRAVAPKVSRRGARTLGLPNGAAGLVGGALGIEALVP
jgi:hypothetical protein